MLYAAGDDELVCLFRLFPADRHFLSSMFVNDLSADCHRRLSDISAMRIVPRLTLISNYILINDFPFDLPLPLIHFV